MHVNGGPGSWQTLDITPETDFEVAVCDASNSPDNRKTLFAASGRSKTDKTKTIVYHVVIENPRLLVGEDNELVASPFTGRSFPRNDV